jgi:hypothetical protein
VFVVIAVGSSRANYSRANSSRANSRLILEMQQEYNQTYPGDDGDWMLRQYEEKEQSAEQQSAQQQSAQQ